MTIGTTLGTGVGYTTAYTKHAAISSGIYGKGFVSDFVNASIATHQRVDSELAARRQALAASRAQARVMPADIIARLQAQAQTVEAAA